MRVKHLNMSKIINAWKQRYYFFTTIPAFFSLIQDVPDPVQSPPTVPTQSGVRASAGEATSIREYPAPGHRIKQVYIYHPITIYPADRFMRTSHFTFYLLSEMQDRQRRKQCLHTSRRIQECVFGGKAPWSGGIKSGQRNYFPHPLFYFPDGETEIMLLIAEISS